MSSEIHPLIGRYIDRHRLPEDALRVNGQVLLRVDDRLRVRLCPAPQGWLAVMSRLCALPPDALRREQLVCDVARMALALAPQYATTCVVDPSGVALWLQRMLPPGSDDGDVDEAVGEVCNALAFWRPAIEQIY